MKKAPSQLMIRLSVGLLSLIWGSTWPAIKLGLRDAPPFFSAALRFVIAALCLLAYMRYKKAVFPATAGFWKRSALLALFMLIIPYAFVYWGGLYVSAGLSSVLFSSQALFVVFCSHYMLAEERATLIKWAGLSVGMSGLVVIFYTRFGIASDLGLLGMLGVLSAALSAAVGLVWLKKTGRDFDHVTELTSQICITAFAFIMLSLCCEKLPRHPFPAGFWFGVVYLAAAGTALAFLIYYWLAKHTTALIISFSVYLTPVLALFLGWSFLDEHIGPGDIAGAFIVILGIMIAQGGLKVSGGSAPAGTAVAEKQGERAYERGA